MDDAPLIKTCGLSDVETIGVAIDAGASAIGFMLAPSKRQVNLDQIADFARSFPERRPAFVAVVVNESAARVRSLFETNSVDIVQLSGDERPALLDGIDGTVWKALRFAHGTMLDDALRTVGAWLDPQRPAARVLIDGAVAGLYGGTGHRADWSLAAGIAERYPVILAGGLTPQNVQEAIATVRPAGVDVSSGIETDGRKDHGKIRAFVTNATQAYQASTVTRRRG